MDAEAYEKIYIDFISAINQNRFISLMAQELLTDFPLKVPDSVMNQIRSDIDTFYREDAAEEVTISAITESFVFLTGADLLQEKKAAAIGSANFPKRILAEELVMLCAHLDSFIIDGCRMMYFSKPEMLKSEKQLMYKDIINAGDWNSLINVLIEKTLFGFGMKSIIERLEYLDTKHGIVISMPPNRRERVDEASKIRNLIVHNGGRVSQVFYNSARSRDNLVVDEPIQLSPEYLEDAYRDIRLLGQQVYSSMKLKFGL